MNTPFRRKTFLCLLLPFVVWFGLLQATGGSPAAEDSVTDPFLSMSRPIPLALDRPLALSVRSSPVEWRGEVFHLLAIHQAKFTLQRDTGHLKADLMARMVTFDRVEYDISAAVFDSEGQLLGTARAACPIERFWVTKPITIGPTLISLNFGDSLAYRDAKTFLITISKRKVLTPDEWGKT